MKKREQLKIEINKLIKIECNNPSLSSIFICNIIHYFKIKIQKKMKTIIAQTDNNKTFKNTAQRHNKKRLTIFHHLKKQTKYLIKHIV
ncbi:MAG: hypothetical protein IPH89_00880 [Bacteroidetes bacterium]|nr:hypothetical protein [Bacteroidota bacterium]